MTTTLPAASPRHATPRVATPRTVVVPEYVLAGVSATVAQQVGEELTSLADAGASTAEDIVTAAKNPGSALHQIIYRHDDREAAHQHRLALARHVSRNLMVKVVDAKTGTERLVRAFYAVTVTSTPREPFKTGEMRSYVTISQVKESPDYASQVRAAAKKELYGWRERYAAYEQEFGGVFGAIDAIAGREIADV